MLIMASQFPWNSSLILPTSLFLPPFTIAMLTSRGPHVAPKDSHSFLPSRGCPSCPKGSGTTAAFYPSSPHSYMDNVFVKHREGPSPQSPATPSQNIPQEKKSSKSVGLEFRNLTSRGESETSDRSMMTSDPCQ